MGRLNSLRKNVIVATAIFTAPTSTYVSNSYIWEIQRQVLDNVLVSVVKITVATITFFLREFTLHKCRPQLACIHWIFEFILHNFSWYSPTASMARMEPCVTRLERMVLQMQTPNACSDWITLTRDEEEGEEASDDDDAFAEESHEDDDDVDDDESCFAIEEVKAMSRSMEGKRKRQETRFNSIKFMTSLKQKKQSLEHIVR